MPSPSEPAPGLGKFGRIVKPVSFDPIQLILWERDRIFTLELETYIGGVVSAHTVLTPRLCADMATELRTIRDSGMKGDWKLGSWARGARFRFKGITRSGDAHGRFSAGSWLASDSFRVSQASFASLLQELEGLSSNKAMERTGYG